MATKMEVNRLSRDELVYELKIRGVDEADTVDSMRRSLRYLMRLEKSTSYVRPKYPFSFAEDTAALEALLTATKALVDTFVGSKSAPEYKKIITRVAHAFGRIGHCKAANDAERATRSSLLVRLIALESEAKSKAKHFLRTSTAIGPVLEQSILSGIRDFSSGTSGTESDTDSERSVVKSDIKPVPVAQWNVKFSGDVKEMSLHAFLERVDELMLARNASKLQLFCSAVDLFRGKALIWYRANRANFCSWDEIVQGLKEEFLPGDFEEKLLEEIKRRTQGPDESIGIYVSVMLTLFARLRVKLSEHVQVNILLRNISPFYQTQLGLIDVKTVKDLVRLCRRLEERKRTVESFVPPPRRSQVMEPDLAYCYADEPPSTSRATAFTVNHRDRGNLVHRRVEQGDGRTCWNCGKVGHLATSCKAPRKISCYRCGRPDFTVRTCPSCNPGNSRQAR